jgi:hypothetical protein
MLEPYYNIKQTVGLNIKLFPDGSVQINACSIIIERNKLNFDKKLTELDDLNALKKYFPGKTTVAISLSGKGILTKIIDAAGQIDPENFNKLMPNAKFEDFYIQNFISDEKSFVTIIRKTEADKWISRLIALDFMPLMLSLAPFPVNHVIPQLNFYDSQISFDGFEILINDKHEWLSCVEVSSSSPDVPLKVESETVDQKLVIPYAVAFQLLLADRLVPINAAIPDLASKRLELVNSKRLRAYAVIMLFFFLIILMVNFLVFTSLNSENTLLYDQMGQRAQNSTNLQKLADLVKTKESFLLDIGYDGNINKISLLDQIAANLPEGVYWQSVWQNPIDFEGSRMQKKLAFFNRKIIITGNSDHIIPLNEWIARVKMKPWVKTIQLDNYTYDNELNTGEFAVTINY